MGFRVVVALPNSTQLRLTFRLIDQAQPEKIVKGELLFDSFWPPLLLVAFPPPPLLTTKAKAKKKETETETEKKKGRRAMI